ncbi:MAG: NAD-dependent protein deacetylase, partial [Candidatus Aminicenantes bacterium]|nr:NAD-dependent protein deacetylase [Candidatus Aminicenantes bacterium]
MNIDGIENIKAAAGIIHEAGALLICAGAGMGVDSGLPDFRGSEGFWNAYPPYRKLGLDFYDLANPEWFAADPTLAWGFYGHRLNLYRRTAPHSGFALLRQWAAAKSAGYFVFTSNVDGQFQKAGFDAEKVNECHGSLHYLQCLANCSDRIWPAADLDIVVEEETMRAQPPLPVCPDCGRLARPNV